MTHIADLHDRLGELHKRTSETPLFNPVFQLGLELSRDLEAGKLSLEELERLVEELEGEGLAARASRLGRLLAPMKPAENDAAITSLARKASDAGESFEAFAARWAQPSAHIVFTAHPTFLLTEKQSEAVAGAVEKGESDAKALTAAVERRFVVDCLRM